MKHTVKIPVATERKTLFGKKTVVEMRKVEVDGKTYRKIKHAEKNRPFSLEEMMFYDFIDGD